MHALYLNATNRALPEQTADSLLDLLLTHAEMVAARSHRAYDVGKCDLGPCGEGTPRLAQNLILRA